MSSSEQLARESRAATARAGRRGGSLGRRFEESVYRGSIERLSSVLMTARCAGLALIPLVLAGGEPGNELQAPMGVVILGGLLSSTALNMIVVPALYAWLARPRATPVLAAAA